MKKFTYLDLQRMRLYNNGVINKFENIDSCVKDLVGIQCQYQNYALISIYNRTNDISKIYDDDSLIKSWGQRTTLHIYHKSDYNIISDIYCLNENWVYKYTKFLNVNYEEYLNAIRIQLKSEPILSKERIKSIIPSYKSKEIMEWSGLLILATYHKVLYGVLNKEDKKIYKINDIEDNKNEKNDFIYRYFKSYGPATKKDFLHWSGLKYKYIKTELDSILSKLNTLTINNKIYYYVTVPNLKKFDIDYPIILGKFDPLLIGYNDKEWILNGRETSLIWKEAGQVEGIILSENGLIATWHYIKKRGEVFFEVNELTELSGVMKELIDRKFNELNMNILNYNKINIEYIGRSQ